MNATGYFRPGSKFHGFIAQPCTVVPPAPANEKGSYAPIRTFASRSAFASVSRRASRATGETASGAVAEVARAAPAAPATARASSAYSCAAEPRSCADQTTVPPATATSVTLPRSVSRVTCRGARGSTGPIRNSGALPISSAVTSTERESALQSSVCGERSQAGASSNERPSRRSRTTIA